MLLEWRLQDIERKADRAVNRLHEIDSLNSQTRDLERELRELSSTVSAQSSEINRLEMIIYQLENRLDDLQNGAA